jgi:hypothetical protein
MACRTSTKGDTPSALDFYRRLIRRISTVSRVRHEIMAGAGVLLAVLFLAATGGAARSASVGASRAEPGFTPIPGWHVLPVGSMTGPIGRSESAANVRFSKGDVGSSAPVKTVAALPKRGVLIWAQFQATGRPTTDRGFPLRRLPLRLNEASVSATPEMFASPGKVLHLDARARGYDIFIYIFFGSPKPSAATRAAANAQLAKLYLPA